MKEVKYNIDFWKNFDKTKITQHSSGFAKYSASFMNEGDSVLDVCCGNKRDSSFFNECGFNVTSFDHETLNLEDKKSRFDLEDSFDNVYCRFVLHCIPEYLEDYVLINSQKVLKIDGLLFIEVRSDKGKIPNRLNDHYRRLINKNSLKRKLERLNFQILSEVESKGLSRYNKENPVIIRFVVKKKGEIETRGTLAEEKLTYCPINPIYSIHLLNVAKRVFEDNNIPFFLIFGTLLGAYRDGGFIKHDTDIDLGLLQEHKEKVMQLINDGYFAIYGLLFTREWHKKGHLKALQYKTDYIDFWFFEKQDGLYKSGKFYNIKANQIDDGFSTIDFYGYKFKTINNVEKYLERHYPDGNWKEPIKDYHAKK